MLFARGKKSGKDPDQEPLSLPVKVAGFYFVLIFVIFPFVVNIYPDGHPVRRIPLLVGIIMMAIAVLQGRKLVRIQMAAQLFFLFSFFSSPPVSMVPTPRDCSKGSPCCSVPWVSGRCWCWPSAVPAISTFFSRCSSGAAWSMPSMDCCS